MAGSEGTQNTIECCETHHNPYLIVDPRFECLNTIREFLDRERPSILNVAGNRESTSKGIAAQTTKLIQTLFSD
jgi:hypothetical protein